jgi:DNA-binding transcriptional LysR family regulator
MRLQGAVNVTAPEGMASLVLPEPLAEFSRRHPGVSLRVTGTSSALDLTRREAEVAIRATRKPPDASLGKRVCEFRFAMYGSPGYLRDHDGTPLSELEWCLLSGLQTWLVPFVWKKLEHAEQRVVLLGSSVMTVLNAVAANVGVTLLPCYLGDPDERLVRIGDPVEALTIELWVLTHPDLRHTARVKVLMEYLFDFLKDNHALFDGSWQRKP